MIIAEAVLQQVLLTHRKQEEEFVAQATKDAVATVTATQGQGPPVSTGQGRRDFVRSHSNHLRALDEVADRTCWKFSRAEGLQQLENAHREVFPDGARARAQREMAEFLRSDACYKKDILENPGEEYVDSNAYCL